MSGSKKYVMQNNTNWGINIHLGDYTTISLPVCTTSVRRNATQPFKRWPTRPHPSVADSLARCTRVERLLIDPGAIVEYVACVVVRVVVGCCEGCACVR